MDFDRFFENLEADYKTILLSVLLCFPMAYVDCWKLSSAFSTLDLFPQIILAAGIAVILVIGGIIANLFYLNFSGLATVIQKLSLFVILVPSVVTTSSVILNMVKTHIAFEFFFAAFTFCLICLAMFKKLRNKQYKRGKEHQQ